MSKVLLQIQYQVKEGKKSELISVLNRIRDHFESNSGFQYSAFENSSKQNLITENFLFENDEAYRSFNETDDEIYDGFVNILTEFIDGSSKYSTFNKIS